MPTAINWEMNVKNCIPTYVGTDPHQALISSSRTVDALSKLDLPSGVDVEIKA